MYLLNRVDQLEWENNGQEGTAPSIRPIHYSSRLSLWKRFLEAHWMGLP